MTKTFITGNHNLDKKLEDFMTSLSDVEIDSLLGYLDSEAVYDIFCQWVDNNRPRLAKELFGDKE